MPSMEDSKKVAAARDDTELTLPDLVNSGRSDPRERDPTVDNLRFTALVSIMFSHVPGILFSEMNANFLKFNVIFMVLPSALGARLSTRKRAYGEYMLEKVKIIVVSAYIFAIFLWFTNKTFNFPLYFDVRNYLMLNTYGNVGCYYWFICGYMAIYAVTPLIKWTSQKISSHLSYFVGVLLVALQLEYWNTYCAYFFPAIWPAYSFWCVNSVFFPVAFAVFYRIPDLQTHQFYALLAGTSAYFIFVQMYHYFFSLPLTLAVYNYPMTTTYVSYGIMCSLFFYHIAWVNNAVIDFLGLQYVAAFMSKHSLWVYFWHFPFVESSSPEDLLYVKAYILFCIAYYLTKAQVMYVERIASRVPSQVVANNLRLTLT